MYAAGPRDDAVALHHPASPGGRDAPGRPTPRLRGVTIVLPCLDEADNVVAAVDAAQRSASRCSVDHEVIVVDDGSTDGTSIVAGRIAARDPRVRLVVHAHNRGYGEALRSGIAAARMEWVLLTDADLQFDLGELERLLPLTAGADVVWGRRVDRQDTARRRASAALWNAAVRALFRLPVSDVDCAFKLIRRDVLDRCALEARGAMISTELLVRARAAGGRVVETGVRHLPRTAGTESGGDLRVIVRALRELLRMTPTLRRLSRPTS